MQEEKRSIQENSEHVVSPSLRTQRILEYLEEQWQCPFAPSNNDLGELLSLSSVFLKNIGLLH